jgi:acetyl-CoA carboxylase biotin carboxylase subunit
MLAKVLIANRGEIAMRIARTCREMRIPTVAIYSTVDEDGAVVGYADEAVRVGPATARASYANPAAIVEAARRTGADAVHPGYGFLAEDADFAEICAENGLTFIGPSPAVLARLGDKASAREAAVAAGLRVLPGSAAPEPNAEAAARVAADIGYPVILKAVAGGGGRGMAVIRHPRDLAAGYATTQAGAQALFGDGRLYVERYLSAARHVEVQILGDAYGTVLHLGTRDCSVQRRRQKLIEETPAPGLPPGVSERICADTVRAARAAGYVGAGTYEFLVDDEGGYYFMEVNCRIQVEHPVTEMVTGVDLVREQIAIAAGCELGLRQADVAARGVAIECRVNAEHPERGFQPTAGRITEFTVPGGPFTRVDTHVRPGSAVPAEYDPLLAKAIVWAPDRDLAIARMDRALHEFWVAGPGVHTTLGFLRRVLASTAFRDGTHTLTLVDELTAGTGEPR